MFERGFKSWCENLSLSLRDELGVAGRDPLSAEAVAADLDVPLWAPDRLGLPADMMTVLLQREAANWSAITVSAGASHAIVYNSTHSPARRSSDIMHELSHLVIEHKPSRIILSADGNLALRSFEREEEDEANWLAGCLLLPRPALLWIERSGMSAEEACREYLVSRPLFTFRRNATGVAIQMKRRGSSRSRVAKSGQ